MSYEPPSKQDRVAIPKTFFGGNRFFSSDSNWDPFEQVIMNNKSRLSSMNRTTRNQMHSYSKGMASPRNGSVGHSQYIHVQIAGKK